MQQVSHHFVIVPALKKSARRLTAQIDLKSTETLVRFLRQGIALLHVGDACYFIAHCDVDIQTAIDSVSSERLQSMFAAMREGELLAPASTEQVRCLHQSEVLGQTVWNVQHIFESSLEQLDVPRLNMAFKALVEGQDILRCHFVSLGEQWLQVISTPSILEVIPVVHIIQMTHVAEFQQFVAAKRAEALAVERASLFKAWACQIDCRWYFGFAAHHAVADAFTLTLLYRQLIATYEALSTDTPATQEGQTGIQYWQYTLDQFVTERRAPTEALQYWGEQFTGVKHTMRLPFKQDPLAVEAAVLCMSESHADKLDVALTQSITAFHITYGITFTQLFTAALNILLIHGMGNSVAVLQSFYSKRDRVALFKTLGEFTNIAITPYRNDPAETVMEFLHRTRLTSLESLRHQVGFSQMLALAGLNNEEQSNPLHTFFEQRHEVLFDSMDLDSGLSESELPGRSLFIEGLMHSEFSGVGEEGQAVATLFYQVLKANEEIVLVSAWRQSLFDRVQMRRLSRTLIACVNLLVTHPQLRLSELLAMLAEDLESLRRQAERFVPGDTTASFSAVTKLAPSDILPVTDLSRSAQMAEQTSGLFVECQLLNRIPRASGQAGEPTVEPRPIFLVHGAFGDASVYLPLAKRLSRTVYGFQAPGLFDQQNPIVGIEQIANRYCEIIRQLQPEGPYDLGGYSIGGTFAFEMSRQLQAAGQHVNSLTLIDALYPTEHERIGVDLYDQLYLIAMSLISLHRRRNSEEASYEVLALPRPDRSLSDRHLLLLAFVDFCRLAGVDKPPEWLRTYFERLAGVQHAYQIGRYRPAALIHPIPVVHYLKNHAGLFYGQRASYMNSRATDPLEAVDYCSRWKTLLPNMLVEYVEVDNHLEMMGENAVQEALVKHFERPPVIPALNASIVRYLSHLFCSVLALPIERVRADATFEQLGMDSLVATELTMRLQAELAEALSITLFFEFQTIQSLAEHLLEVHPRAVAQIALRLQQGGVDLSSSDALMMTQRGTALNKRPLTPEVPSPLPTPRAGSELGVSPTSPRSGDIAIIGVSGRYPGARDLDAYWKVLQQGIDCITEVPADRWSWPDYFTEDRTQAGVHFSKWGGFIEDVDKFDSLFFNISPREAEIIDPQERLFLEHVWTAIEDAGYRAQELRADKENPYDSSVSVYVGVMSSEYQFLAVEQSLKGNRRALGGSYASIANRISHTFDFHGPSLSIDTACSSSLTAIHMACRDLREGVSHVAIAGGVNLSIHPNKYLLLSAGQFISSSGRCKSFGEGEGGFVPSEGVGVVVLKRLEDAQRDGDHIHAILKGSAVNHGGRTHGYTVPNPVAQEQVIRQAMSSAGIAPRAISYVEAHGTGTTIGDPIEITGLTRAFGWRHDEKLQPWCWLGSVKSNLGHCESAAGIAGLTKIVLQMRHGCIAPSLHSASLNSHIDFSNTPFTVNQELRQWERPVIDGNVQPRLAGLSSFGAGGANAHLLVEEYCPPASTVTPNAQLGSVVIVLSAKNEDSLRLLAGNLSAWLAGQGHSVQADLHDIAYTLQVGREPFNERVALLVDSKKALIEKLALFANETKLSSDVFRGQVRQDNETVALFEQDVDLHAALLSWIAQGKLDKVLALWVQGLSFDWLLLHQQRMPKRMSLPTYPFARERHWLEPSGTSVPALHVQQKQSGFSQEAAYAPEVSDDLLLAVPAWRAAALPLNLSSKFFANRIVVFCGFEMSTHSESQPQDASNWVWLNSVESQPATQFIDYAGQVFELLRERVQMHGHDSTLVQVLVSSDAAYGLLSGLSGLLKTVSREYPAIVSQLIECSASATRVSLAELAQANARAYDDPQVRYAKDGGRYVLTWSETALGAATTSPWRTNGVYLITGGLGGLGLIFARAIARSASASTLILVGRSKLDLERSQLLDELTKLGGFVQYRQVDVEQQEQVAELIDSLRSEGLAPTGIIHSAGMIRDNFMLKKSTREFKEVLAAKVLGCVNLDLATKALPLELFVLFSSAAGALGNAGQADYACANAWLDAFAQQRSQQVMQGMRQGRTLSVDWPLWRDGGMQVDRLTQIAIENASGAVPLSTELGVAAFDSMLVGQAPQYLLVQGDLGRLRDYFIASKLFLKEEAQTFPTKDFGHQSATLLRLCALFGEIVKLPAERVDPLESLSSYGVDSVMVVQLNQKLEAVFGAISKTLFFEFTRLKDVATHLFEHYPATCVKWSEEAGLTAGSRQFVPLKSRPALSSVQSPLAKASEAYSTKALSQSASLIAGSPATSPIAIIGLSGHYPQSPTLEAFWENLREGRHLVTEIPPSRWSLEGFYEPDMRRAIAQGKSYSKWGALLESFAEFDPFFFNISPREARAMDPQERWLLRCAWEAVENAGYTRETLVRNNQGRVGVFAGITNTGFDLYGPELWSKGDTTIPRTSFSSAANRISYFLDLKGPSMAIDTMCSSSLTALHEACEQLRRGSCEMAIAAAVNLYTHPSSYRNLSANRMLSVDGVCKSFGLGANGFVPGEGVGALLLKPLEQAQAHGDVIHAVIRATHVNHGGKTNGYTVPSPQAQANLIRESLDLAGVNAREISYFEAHGTGTDLGDPIEVDGMIRAFRADTQDCGYCALGSVKSNIGHLEAAAGLAGLTKIILQMKHRELVPSLHAEQSNPNIDFSASPFVVTQSLTPWQRPRLDKEGASFEAPRMACLSSFGAGGANAHVVLQEYIPESATVLSVSALQPQVIVLSARNELQLKASVALLEKFLSQTSIEISLSDLSYTLLCGREQMKCRLGFVALSLTDALTHLRNILQGDTSQCIQSDLPSNQELLSVFLNQQSTGYSRIILPTYPFAQERYWFEQTHSDATSPQEPHFFADDMSLHKPLVTSVVSGWDGLSYAPSWEPAPLSKVVGALPEREALACSRVLMLAMADTSALARGLIHHLEQQIPGVEIIQVQLEELSALSLEEWLEHLPSIASVYFLAGGTHIAQDIQQAVQTNRRHEFLLLRLMQTLCRRAGEQTLDCFMIRLEGAQSYLGGLDGFAYALAQSQFRCRVFNLLVSTSTTESATELDALLRAIQREPRAERGEAIRFLDGVRYKQVLLPLQWAEVAKLPGLKRQGVYLILGGAGVVGRAITRQLVAKYQAQVIWIGRSSPESSALRQALAEYSGQSYTPRYLQADVLDLEGFRHVVQDVIKDYGHLDGAIFAPKLIALQDTFLQCTEKVFKTIVDARTLGIVNFDLVLNEYSPGFICYFSSAQSFSFLPANESVSYATAVTAADSLVRTLPRQSDSPVGIMHWGYWASSVVGTDVESSLARHFRFISDEAGFKCFENFVSALRAQLLPEVLCVGVRESAERLMSRHANDQLCVARSVDFVREKSQVTGVARAFAHVETAPGPLSPVATRTQRAELEHWVARLLGLQMLLIDSQQIKPAHVRLTREFEALAIPETEASIWHDWSAYRETLVLPELKAATELAESCLRALPDIVSGKIRATDVIFPGGSLRKVEALYRGNGLSDYFNRALADVVLRLVSESSGGLKIIEIGAGTGSTTDAVTRILHPVMGQVQEYRYTDLSQAFLIEARKRYDSWFTPMTYGILDIEQSPHMQGVETGDYDIVIATNVLHATRNISETLRNCKALLKRGGVILINEVIEKSAVGTVTFGLLEGWWSYEDDALRIPGSPLLDVAGWSRALAKEGFLEICTITEGSAEYGQEVIAAISDGLIRQCVLSAAPVSASGPTAVSVSTSAYAFASTPEFESESVDVLAAESVSAPSAQRLINTKAVQAVLREALVQTLGGGSSEIAADIAFSDYGVDSILGVSLVERINERFNLTLNATVLFEYSTLSSFSRYLCDTYSEQLALVFTLANDNHNSVREELASVPKLLGNQVQAQDHIAVIGFAGRVAGAQDVEAFWRVLISGVSVIGELPQTFAEGEDAYRWGAVLSERDCFDPLFFNISPREAESMNRHQRLVMQEGWRALEDAGYNPRTLIESRTGIFVGAEPGGWSGESFTGASDAIIASRLSYFLGLRGPALVVNTGCSSSGVAIHLACQSLRTGESDMALAAGVCATLNPATLRSLAHTGMLSPTGRCLSFDDQADGTVLSEGVGVVVLKRLVDALASDDNIIGVIVASGINQDGASNGITAPSGSAQESLLSQTYARFGIDPSTISYIETHGTGTPLGDPVEANALKRAFAGQTAATNFCALGSAKAHIGHTSAASGVIGLIKVLLSMRHQILPGLPGFQRLNERISFEGSPFYIHTQPKAWDQTERPVRAAMSSFGHSGTNAHLVLDQFLNTRPNLPVADWGVMPVPVSARDATQLREVVRRLADYLRQHLHCSLGDLAYTLQTGREPMEVRLLFVSASVSELLEHLNSFLYDGSVCVPNVPFYTPWIKGETIDWDGWWLNYSSADGKTYRPRRISLPGYPFAMDSYPVAETNFNPSVSVESSVSQPLSEPLQSYLVWRNVSDFDGLHFITMLSGEEFFIQDHRLGTRRILPGVVYLEAARAAVTLATGRPVAALEDVTWEASIEVAESPVALHITLSLGAAGEICYVMFTEHSDSDHRATDHSGLFRQIHSRGVARLQTQAAPTTIQAWNGSSLNLLALKEITLLSHPSLEDCAAAFEAQGIHYGPSLRAVEVLRVGEAQVLARLALPESVCGTQSDFLLHPSLMDCALQCAMALTLMSSDLERAQAASLPFALERLDILAPLPESVWVWVRRAQGSIEGSAVQKLDLDWLDEGGRILVRMCGFSSRQPLLSSAVVEDPLSFMRSLEGEVPKQTVLHAPVWNLSDLEQPVEAELSGNAHVLVVGGNSASRAQIYAYYPNSRYLNFHPSVEDGSIELRLSQRFEHIVWIAPELEAEHTEEERFAFQADCVMYLFALIEALHRANYTLQELNWTVLTRQAVALDAFAVVNPAHAAVHGLVGSMAKEFPHWRVRLLDLDAVQTWPVSELFARPFDTDGEVQILREDKWYQRSLAPVALLQGAAPSYRQQGVYLVIGGAGGLGEVWSRYLIQNYSAQIIWIGRRALDQDIQSKIDALSAFGPAPLYLQADGAEPGALERVYEEITSRYHHLHGVVHSALVLRDKSLVGMAAEDFRAGLKPKLDLSVRLAEVFTEKQLDFILFFSSLQSFSKAPGQSNYAAGSTFLDSFAHQLALKQKCVVKVMNWGYWGSVGIVAAEYYRERMTKAGLGSIEPQEGMDGLDCLLASPFRQLVMFKTTSAAPPDPSQQTQEPLMLYPALIPSILGMFES